MMRKNIPRSEITRPAPPGWSYRAIDLERQQRKPDGSWSDWSFVDPETNLAILDNLPELEEELIPPDFRVEALVDPLPFLIDGKWQGVNHPVFIAEALRPVKRLVEPVRPGEVPEVHVPELMSRTFDFSVSPGGTYRLSGTLGLASSQTARWSI